ncbi:MAG: phage portal protein [Gemmataceae bacterium]|nr:phage portal protein [Gemmataceae bacterium]
MKIFGVHVPFTQRASPSVKDDRWFSPTPFVFLDGSPVTPDTAIKMSAVYGCVRVISQTLGALPLMVYRRLPGDGKERAVGAPLYKLLRTRPNRYKTSGLEFRERLTLHTLLYGNGYAQILRNRLREPVELIPIHPTRVRPELTDRDELVYRVGQRGGAEILLPADQVLHIRALLNGGLEGLSPAILAEKAIRAGLSLESFGMNFFEGGAFPGGVLEYPAEMSDEAKKNLSESWERLYGGENRGRKVAVLEAGLTYKPHAIPQTDAQFLEQRKLQVIEVCRFFGVPPHLVFDLDRATFCMPADTEVSTEFGPKPIADVRPGERVWSWDGDAGLTLAPVERAGCTGEDEILEIRTSNRTVRANARHRFLVRRKLPAPRAGKGGYQAVEWANHWVPAGELRRGDVLVALNRLPGGGTDRAPTRTVSVGFMEFCGLLLGDGTVRKGWGVSIARADTAKYMDHYRGVIRAEFFKTTNGNRGWRTRRRAPVTVQDCGRQTRFASAAAAEELTELGFAGTAFTKSVPGWVFGLTEELKLAFLRGFLDADGTVDKKGRVAFHSVNRPMLSQIRHLCMGLGVPVTNLRKGVGYTRLPNGKRFPFAIHTFTCSDPGQNRRIGSNDPRYLPRLAAGKPFGRKARNYPDYGGRGFAIAGCSLSRIAAIEVVGREPVYDLTVAGTHSFVADGVVVHNSNIEEQNQNFVDYGLLPWFKRWEEAITRDLLDGDDSVYFAEFLADGLLRGNSAARSQAYALGRQWGWYSINEIRARENLNSIGPEGDVYLTPLNMVPAGTEGQHTAPTPKEDSQDDDQPNDSRPPEAPGQRDAEPAEGQPGEAGRQEEVDRVRAAFRGAVRETWTRVVRKEVNAVKTAARRRGEEFDPWFDEFLGDHRSFAVECLREIARSYCVLRGFDVDMLLPGLVDEYRSTVRDAVASWKAEPGRGYDRREDEIASYWTERLLGYSGGNYDCAA